MVNLSTETPDLSIDVSQTFKNFVQESALATKGSALGAIAQVEQFTDESFENASHALSNLVAGGNHLQLNPQNLSPTPAVGFGDMLSRPETLAIAGGFLVTALAYSRFGVAGVGAVVLLALAAGCNENGIKPLDPNECQNYYPDVDGDGYGNENAEKECLELEDTGDILSGYSTDNTDCDDDNAAINPVANEICDEIDNNCRDGVDESTAIDASFWYEDGDIDGYGNPDSSEEACTQPEGYVGNDDDCDDTNNSLNFEAEYYQDSDGDGYGDPNSTTSACGQPDGYLEDNTDCDDSSNLANPGITEETCNDDLDNDCNGEINRSIDSITRSGTICLSTVGSTTNGTRLIGEAYGDQAGYWVTSLGDIDKDGDDDISIGAPYHCYASSSSQEGVAYLLRSPITESDALGLSSASARLIGESAEDLAGGSIAAGDIDNDSWIDLILGASRNDSSATNGGAVYLFSRASSLTGDVIVNAANCKLTGTGENEIAGESVAASTGTALIGGRGGNNAYLLYGSCTSGTLYSETDAYLSSTSNGTGYTVALTQETDANGDTNPDALITVPDDTDGGTGADGGAGALYLKYGPVSGNVALESPDYDVKFLGEQDYQAGISASFLPDMDGDGKAEVFTGANVGSVAYLVNSSSFSSLASGSQFDLPNDADATFIGEASDDGTGAFIASVEDADNDGYDDVMIGAPNNDRGGDRAGTVYLVYGPFAGDISLAEVGITVRGIKLIGETAGDLAGSSVSSAGDTDGDGRIDLLMGAPWYSDGGNIQSGIAYLILNSGF